MIRVSALLIIVTSCILWSGCSSSPLHQPPSELVDGPPAVSIDITQIKDAVPKVEPLSRYGNHSPYIVNNKRYEVLKSAVGYQAEGIASWYGTKFHGRRTSSWELYDLNAMTAAHRSLPLPTYVRVTNLQNQREVIVRVNDRGPFHDERIIDLSYAAANKLVFVEQGTVAVRVEAIVPTTPSNNTESKESAANITTVETLENTESIYIQVGAFKDLARSKQLKNVLSASIQEPIHIVPNPARDMHRVRIGPVKNEQAAHSLKKLLMTTQQVDPIILRVSRPTSDYSELDNVPSPN